MEAELQNIRDLSVHDRPREKLSRHGAAMLSNTELLAIILGSGSQAVPLASICKSLTAAISNNIANLDAMDIGQISKVKGIGKIKAIHIKAAIELGKRSLRQAATLSLKDDSSVETLLAGYLAGVAQLQYHLVLMNHRSELLATAELQTATGKLPDIKHLIKLSLEAAAAEIMLCRNDVKLNARYENEEKAFVIRLDAAASMLQIKLRGLLVVRKKPGNDM